MLCGFMPQKKQPLPASLARNAQKKATAAARAAAAEAKALVAEIQEKKRQIEDAFYDMGVALTALSQPRLYTALGHSSFAALVENELGMALGTVKRLIAIPKELTRKRALGLGQSKSLALIRLAAATPEPDTAEQLARGRTRVRGHRTPIRPGKMSAREIERAAKTERSAHRSKSKRPADSLLTEAEAWAERATAKLKGVATFSVKQRRRDGSLALGLVVECEFGDRSKLVKVLGDQR